MNKEKIAISIIIAITLISAVGIISGDSKSDSDKEVREYLKQEIKKETSNFTVDDSTTQEFKSDFLEGCTDDDSSNLKECNCMYDYAIDQKDGFGRLVEIGVDITLEKELTDNQTELMINAVTSCYTI